MSTVYRNSSQLSTNQTLSQAPVICDACINMSFVGYSVAYTANFLVGLPANGWVLWLMMSSPGFLTDKMEAFEFSLALNDLLFCLASPTLVFLRIPSFRQPSWYLLAALQALLFVGRPLFQTCVSLERYLAVVHPMVFLRYRPLRYRAAISALVWLADITFGYSSFALCTNESLAINIIAGVQLLLFFLANSFCCLSILRALRQPGPGDGGRRRAGGDGGEREKEKGMNVVKRRAFATVLAIQVSMVFGYLPNLVFTAVFSYLELSTACPINLLFFFVMVAVGFMQPLLFLRRAGKLDLHCITPP